MKRIFDSDNFRWYTKDGELNSNMFAGVTGILDVAVPKTLQNYMKNNSAAKQARTLQSTGDMGTLIHKMVEDDLNGVKVTPTELAQSSFDNWLKIKEEHQIKAIYTEKMVHSDKYGFAGTADIIGYYDGQPCIMDIKTGYFSVKAGWQMAAYKLAYEEMTGESGLGMVGIQIKRDGTGATVFKFEHLDWCLKSFVSCFEVFKALYFTKLAKIEWAYLHKNSLEALTKNKN